MRVDGIPAVFHDHRSNQRRQSAGDPLYLSSCFTFYYFRRLKKKRGKESFRPFGTWRLSFVPQAVSFISFELYPYRPDGRTYFRYGGSHCLSRGGLRFEAARRASGNLAVLAGIFLRIIGSARTCPAILVITVSL